MYKGIAASPGIAIGKAYVLGLTEIHVKKHKLSADSLDKEIEKFKGAIEITQQEIEEVKKRVAREVGSEEAEIFNAYLHILRDPMLIQASIDKIKSQAYNAEYVLQNIANSLIQQFLESNDEYLQERVADINDVVARLLRNLTGQTRGLISEAGKDIIVVAKDLAPSQTASMRKESVISFITEVGGKTSHVAIMARSLEIPAVVGLKDIMTQIKTGDTLIVDGSAGVIIINPTQEKLIKYRQMQQKMLQSFRKLRKLKGVTAVTKDGYRLTVAANIELPEDVHQAVKYGAEGVGLFRTEFLYMDRRDLPSEEEQFEVYSIVARHSLPYATIIRTLDLGGDKFLSRLGTSREMNPFLGLRAIRLCLAHVELFKTQLRAILRASHFGKIKIMFPLISDIDEFIQAKEVLKMVQAELNRKKIPYDKNMEIGLMIELPSAAVTADILAKEAHFFSIGTNDLIQYTLAADRVNEKVAYLYNPLSPAILRLIKQTVEAAHAQNIWVGMCGEMASDPQLISLLLGMGIDEFSTGPSFVPQVKQRIRELYFAQSKDLANNILSCHTAREVAKILRIEKEV